MIHLRFCLFISLLTFVVIKVDYFPQTVTGKILYKDNQPLPFANIFCPTLDIGTTSNSDGEFIFKLTPGEMKIIFSYVGYISDTLTLKLKTGENIIVNITLQENPAEMQTVYVFGSELSEAERIILKTISSKTDYINRIKSYTYNSYNKVVLSIKEEDTLAIGGVLETFTKAFYESPDKFNEVILAKRQTKNFSSMNNIFTMGKVPNALDEEISIDEISVISPLSSNTLNYYSFKIIDTTYYNNRKVFRLQFEPKNKLLPLFTGEIGIIDSLFIPVSLKLLGEKNVITAARKDIEVEEKLTDFDKEFWMPIWVKQKFRLNIDFPGYPSIYWDQICLLSDYKINSPNLNHVFTKNIQSEDLLPAEKGTELFNTNQQIILTTKEKKAVARIDSVMENAGVIWKSLFWLMQNMIGANNLPITSFNDFYHFNRVEGHYAGIGIEFNNIFDRTNFTLKTGYGFSDKKLKYDFKIDRWKYKFSCYAGLYNKVNKLDRFLSYSDFDITFQGWVDKNDFADYFYSNGFEAGVGYQFHEDFSAGFNFNKRKDKNASLNSDWSLFNKDGIYRNVPVINEGDVTEYSCKIIYDNKKYFDFQLGRFPDRSKNYFDAELLITRGYYSNGFSGSYWMTHLKLSGKIQLASWLNPSYLFNGGINSGLKLLQNKFHLPGNYGTLGSLGSFNSISRDEFLGNRYTCLFIENNFSNVLYRLLDLPYLKNSKHDFIIFGKYGWIDEEPQVHISKNFYEAGFGIGNIFAFLRLDFTWRLQPHSKSIFYVNTVSMYSL